MTPIPVNPTVTILVQRGKVIAAANNIDPELTVNIVESNEAYGEAIHNLPFDSANPRPQTQVLAARH